MSGNQLRVRLERTDGRTEDGVAPIGLWRNCYDSSWLKSLRPHVRKSLNAIKSDYRFTLPPLGTLLGKAQALAATDQTANLS